MEGQKRMKRVIEDGEEENSDASFSYCQCKPKRSRRKGYGWTHKKINRRSSNAQNNEVASNLPHENSRRNPKTGRAKNKVQDERTKDGTTWQEVENREVEGDPQMPLEDPATGMSATTDRADEFAQQAAENLNINEQTADGKQKEEVEQEDEEELEEEDDFDSGKDDTVSKVVTGHMTSLRADLVLKTGLGMARNKIETLFYESKIRVNGEKINKKSQRVGIGDEVDVIKGTSPVNPSLMMVSRVVVLSTKEHEDGDKIAVRMRRYKSLSVENTEINGAM